MLYRIFEGVDYFYIVATTVGRSSICRISRLNEPPHSLADIIHFLPASESEVFVTDCCRLIVEAQLIVGFVRFLGFYILVVCTKAEPVGSIEGHFVYTINNTQTINISPPPPDTSNIFFNLLGNVTRQFNQTTTESTEKKYRSLFQFVDLTKDFYFSYNYNLTRSRQSYSLANDCNTEERAFVWNSYLTHELADLVPCDERQLWVIPLIHGFYQQKRFSSFGKMFDIILIARRSQYFAGTRYLKRGCNDDGRCANDCEVEIVLQMDGLSACASHVMMRGSVPVFWSQETSVTVPKPPIILHKSDPCYLATRRHFLDLFRRYGRPLLVLDLVKQMEKRKRESILGREFFAAVDILNGGLPTDMKIRYCALDFSRISSAANEKEKPPSGVDRYIAEADKSLGDARDILPCLIQEENRLAENQRGADGSSPHLVGAAEVGRRDRTILEELDQVAHFSLSQTSFFCTKLSRIKNMGVLQTLAVHEAQRRGVLLQRGVSRTNCVDCLDRTNVAQFAVGVKFLAVGLFALGLSESVVIASSSPVLKCFVNMFSEMGDRLAIQYGGSEAHKRVASGQAISTQGELLTSIKRYYSNAFTDRAKQDAINLFLGAFVPRDPEQTIALWDLDSDYHLHHHVRNREQVGCTRTQRCFSVDTDEDVRGVAQDIDGLHEDEVHSHPLFTRYVVNHAADAKQSLRLMVESERRKEWARLEMHNILETEQLEWRAALLQFTGPLEARPRSLTREGLSPPVPLSCEYECFDDVLSLEFSKPADSSSYKQGVDLMNEYELTEAQLPPPSMDDDDIIALTRQLSDDVSSLIGEYSRGISFRAKSLIDGLLPPSVSTIPIRPTPPAVVLSARQGSWTAGPSSSYLEIDPASSAMYASYVSDPDQSSDADLSGENSEKLEVYRKSLWGLSLSVDDMMGMEQLAENLGLCSTLNEGPYAGMSSTESSLQASGVLDTTALYLERHLFSQDSSSQSSSRLSENFCASLDTLGAVEGLTGGQRNEILNRSIRYVSDLQFYSSFVEESSLSHTKSVWSRSADEMKSFRDGYTEERKPVAAERGRGGLFPGFVQVGHDHFRRVSNPLMFMNEVGAAAFVSTFKSLSPP